MDFCRNRNIAVSGGLPSEYHQPEQLLSPSCSNPGTLDDLFSTHNTTEGDVSLEWLSIFVEDCFSSSGNCISVPPVAVPAGMGNELHKITPNNNGINYTASTNAMPLQLETKAPIKQQQNASSLHKFVIPGKARSKRKRGPLLLTKPKSQTQFTSWWSHHRIIEGNPLDNISLSCSSDPPLLQQACWLADSELILPKTKKEDEDEDDDIYNRSNSNGRLKATERRGDDEGEGEGEGEEDDQEGKEEDEEEVVGKKNMSSNGQQQQGRRCSHCLAQRTPQWRAGPMGPKTLCNACGVRYKSGRLLPEYRPAKSPTFVSYKHSNSHKKVMEMRMALPSSPPS